MWDGGGGVRRDQEEKMHNDREQSTVFFFNDSRKMNVGEHRFAHPSYPVGPRMFT